MSAVNRRTANELLCGPILAPLLEYAVVILVHGVSFQNYDQFRTEEGYNLRCSVQIARVNEELPILKTKTVPIDRSVFEEVLVVHTETLEELELLLCTAEEVVDEYRLRLAEWSPFTHHHLALLGQSSELLISAVVKSRSVPISAPPPTLDLQLMVQYLETPIVDPKEGVIIIASDTFAKDISQLPLNSEGNVQVTVPQGPSDQPQWYHTFLFRGCSVEQSLGLHFFHQPQVFQETQQWRLGEKLAECQISLDRGLLALLEANPRGVCFTRLPLASCQPSLFAKVSLKLGCAPALTPNEIPEIIREWGDWSSEVPPSAAPPDDKPSLVTVGEEGGEEGEEGGGPLRELVLPEHSAIMKLLERHASPGHSAASHQGRSAEYLGKVIEQQAAELAKYREAVQKMGHDILACRDHIVKLKEANRSLKRTVGDLQAPVESIAGASRDDLAREVRRSRDIIKEQRGKLDEMGGTLKTMKKVATKYENERREMNELRNAHTAQNQLLQKLQDKVKVTRLLEKTCRDQEKVIEQLEAMVRQSTHRATGPGPGASEQLALPAPVAVPKLEPVSDAGDLPMDTGLRLKIRELENRLRFSEDAHKEQLADLMAEKMDLKMQLTRYQR